MSKFHLPYNNLMYLDVQKKKNLVSTLLRILVVVTDLASGGVDSFDAVSATPSCYHCVILTELSHIQILSITIVWVGDVFYQFTRRIIPQL